MSKWAQAKQILELDWRTEWKNIAAHLQGLQPADVVALVFEMDTAYHQRDAARFLVLKAQLVKHPSWTGSNATLNDNPAASSAKPTAAPTQLGWLT